MEGDGVEVHFATVEAAKAVAARLRYADWHEAHAATGISPEAAIVRSVRLASDAFYFTIHGQPACIVGVSPISFVEGRGCIWMVGTDMLDGRKRLFMEYSRLVLNHFKKQYRILENHVDARYGAAIRWLKWLGFEMEDAAPFGPFGVPFHRFEMRT